MFLPSVSPSQFALIAHNINLQEKKKKTKVNKMANLRI